MRSTAIVPKLLVHTDYKMYTSQFLVSLRSWFRQCAAAVGLLGHAAVMNKLYTDRCG
jgi:hypothetical protein